MEDVQLNLTVLLLNSVSTANVSITVPMDLTSKMEFASEAVQLDLSTSDNSAMKPVQFRLLSSQRMSVSLPVLQELLKSMESVLPSSVD